MMATKIVDGERVEISAEELAQIEASKPAPDLNTYTIHAAWLKAYLRSQGWEAELNGLVDAAGPVAQALWESGTAYRVDDKLVVDLWASHSQSATMTVQEVFNAAAALRDENT